MLVFVFCFFIVMYLLPHNPKPIPPLKNKSATWAILVCRALAAENNHIKYKALHRRARPPYRTVSFDCVAVDDAPNPANTHTRDSW